MDSLTGKITLVAGGTGGVGEGIVKALLQENAVVIVPTRTAEKAASLKDYVSDIATGNLVTLVGEMSSMEGIYAMQNELKKRFDHLDLVVASLGGWWQGLPLTSVTLETWQKILNNNLTSHFLAIKAFVPFLTPKTGAYIHINGFGSEEIIPFAAPTTMAAAAQKMLVQTLAAELKPTNIKVWELILGPMQTRQRLRMGHGQADWYTPEEIGVYIAELYNGKNEKGGEVLHYLLNKALPKV
jgi:NAD(P)-dependent dehydrogenase (short-subunit alcohol dehydrogenase family)